MFSIGQELYNLTARDLETLLVEPFFRSSGTVTIGAASTEGSNIFNTIPPDRCLYLDSFVILANPGALQSIVGASLILVNRNSPTVSQPLWDIRSSTTLNGTDNGQGALAGDVVSFSEFPKILLPPGAQPGFVIRKSGVINAGAYTAHVNGYLLPPGGIGRTF